MKLNKNGITSIELLVSFIIVSVVVVGMFSMIMNYKNKQQIEEINNEVISYVNSIQRMINDDLINRKVKDIEFDASNPKKIIFYFNGAIPYATLILKPDDGFISYGYDTNEQNLIDYEITFASDWNLYLGDESRIEEFYDEENSTWWIKITLVFHHPNFENETATYTITSPINYN